MVVFPFLVVVFLSTNLIHATHSTNRDDLQDQMLTEMKKMIQSQAEMLQKYGERIDSLEKENHDLVKQTEALQIANGVMETRLSHLEQASVDVRPGPDVLVSTGQSTQDVEDQEKGQPYSAGIRDEDVRLADDKLSRMRKVADVDHETAVGFYAMLRSLHDVQLGEHQTIEFDNVVTNVGSGYDSRHGHFTAPVAGLYSLTSTVLLMHSNNHAMHFTIVKNSVDVGYLYSNTAYDKGTRTVVLSLAVGDMVWVRNNENNSPAVHGGYSSFSGVLITPTCISQGR